MNCSIAVAWSFRRWPNGAMICWPPIAGREAPPSSVLSHPELADFVQRVVAARCAGRPVILMMGAHADQARPLAVSSI